MKKLLQALAVLFAVTVLFVGCNKDAEPAAASDTAPLFSKNATTLPVKGILLTNGDWKARIIRTFEDNVVEVMNVEFTISDSIDNINASLREADDEKEEVAEVISPKLVYTKMEYIYSSIGEKNSVSAEQLENINKNDYNYEQFIYEQFNPGTLKTNADHTKFYGEGEPIVYIKGNDNKVAVEIKDKPLVKIDDTYDYAYYYLMKK